MTTLKTNIGKLPFVNAPDQATVIRHILKHWDEHGHCLVHFMYYASLVRLKRDPEFVEALASGDFLLIDGIGMQLYMKCVKGLWPNNLNGTDLSPLLLKAVDELSKPIALYGTTPESMEQAFVNLQDDLSNKSVYYTQDGFSPLDWEAIRHGSVLMVGMGSPRQERWSLEQLEQIRSRKLLVVTVGGFFDFASGVYVRAPQWVRSLKLEWAWRTMLHPGRHLKKRLLDLTIFFKPWIDRLAGYRKHIHIRHL